MSGPVSPFRFALRILAMLRNQREHPKPPRLGTATKAQLREMERSYDSVMIEAWFAEMRLRKDPPPPPEKADPEQEYRLAVRAFVAEHPDLFVPLAAAVNHDVRVRRHERGDTRPALPTWASARWMARLSPILDAFLSHGIVIGKRGEEEWYRRHPEGLHATVATEVFYEVLSAALTGYAPDHEPFYAVRLFAEAFVSPYFTGSGQPVPGTARAWPTQLPGSVVAHEPSAALALSRARRHAWRIMRRRTPRSAPPESRRITSPAAWESDDDLALHAVIERFVMEHDDLFAPLALAYLHDTGVSHPRPGHTPLRGMPVTASAHVSRLLDIMLRRFIDGRPAIAAHGPLAAARVFCWVVMPLLDRLGRPAPQIVIQTWVTHRTPIGPGTPNDGLTTPRAWPADPDAPPLAPIHSNAEMLTLLHGAVRRIADDQPTCRHPTGRITS